MVYMSNSEYFYFHMIYLHDALLEVPNVGENQV